MILADGSGSLNLPHSMDWRQVLDGEPEDQASQPNNTSSEGGDTRHQQGSVSVLH